jgi:hypothetical protein
MGRADAVRPGNKVNFGVIAEFLNREKRDCLLGNLFIYCIHISFKIVFHGKILFIYPKNIEEPHIECVRLGCTDSKRELLLNFRMGFFIDSGRNP